MEIHFKDYMMNICDSFWDFISQIKQTLLDLISQITWIKFKIKQLFEHKKEEKQFKKNRDLFFCFVVGGGDDDKHYFSLSVRSRNIQEGDKSDSLICFVVPSQIFSLTILNSLPK